MYRTGGSHYGPHLEKRVDRGPVKIPVVQGPRIPVGLREVPSKRLWGSGTRLTGSHSWGGTVAPFLLLQGGDSAHTPHSTSGVKGENPHNILRAPGLGEHLLNVSEVTRQGHLHLPPALHLTVSKSARP